MISCNLEYLLKQYWMAGYKLNKIEELLFEEDIDLSQEDIQFFFKSMMLKHVKEGV